MKLTIGSQTFNVAWVIMNQVLIRDRVWFTAYMHIKTPEHLIDYIRIGEMLRDGGVREAAFTESDIREAKERGYINVNFCPETLMENDYQFLLGDIHGENED